MGQAKSSGKATTNNKEHRHVGRSAAARCSFRVSKWSGLLLVVSGFSYRDSPSKCSVPSVHDEVHISITAQFSRVSQAIANSSKILHPIGTSLFALLSGRLELLLGASTWCLALSFGLGCVCSGLFSVFFGCLHCVLCRSFVLCDKGRHVKLAFATSVVHVSDLSKHGSFLPTHVVDSHNAPSDSDKAVGVVPVQGILVVQVLGCPQRNLW